MKCKYFINWFKTTQLRGHLKRAKQIKWEQLLYFILLVSVYNSCDVLSTPTKKPATDVGAYMWSSTFEAVDNQSLVSFLKDEDLTSVFLSLGFDDPLLEKAKQFVQIANEMEIEVHLLFGGNEIVNGRENDQLSTLNQISEVANQIGVNEIHLDIEPHTFEDWDLNRSEYENKFLELLEKSRFIFSQQQLKLSVSIPHFYDSINPEIEKYVDEAVVMVYETTDIDIIKSRTEEETSIFGEKLSIALRPEDYSNFEALEEAILQIMASGTAKRIYLHDAGALINT